MSASHGVTCVTGKKRSGFKSLPFWKPSSVLASPWLATPSACYTGPKPLSCRKWLGEGAKGVLTSRKNGLPRVSCTSATLLRSTYTKHLTHPLLATLGNFEVSGPCSRHLGSQTLEGFSQGFEKPRQIPVQSQENAAKQKNVKDKSLQSSLARVALKRQRELCCGFLCAFLFVPGEKGPKRPPRNPTKIHKEIHSQ